ncbi:DUF983 domain-containing protein [Aliiruegeria sabulilitoris]|uniref:DUF983 domain-containing protein n=1 Tax=Aliiruegeria sabulilitoris TaxID=1510458 RepID=UPI000830774A|nr:DUF983 domain-containing protein [Aliiruegeria sabulilitoris]NDR59232.1 DUF983 domain-containing protein [Pseudoruegeria sp. M32A2M]
MCAVQQMPEERPVRPAMARGWRRRCPNCGRGPLLSGYLKVADHCPVCEQEFHHQRADDGPAYITILIVGHLLAPLIHVFYARLHLEPLVMASILSVLCIALSLYLLPRIKGAFIGLQWARRMHGFGSDTSGAGYSH